MDKTFAPVVEKVTVRTFLSQAAAPGMLLYQMDVTTAFLYGDTLQQMYVLVPDEFRTEEELSQDLVRMLLKSLFGTPDAPRIWYSVLSTHLNKHGKVESVLDPCLFFSEDMQIWIIVYVDDLIIASNTIESQEKIIEFLQSQF